MPIYEYSCTDCDHQFETIQKLSDDPLTICPKCGNAALKKLLSAPSFRLKGSGWYETDFKDKNRKNGAGSDDSGSSGSSDSAGGEAGSKSDSSASSSSSDSGSASKSDSGSSSSSSSSSSASTSAD